MPNIPKGLVSLVLSLAFLLPMTAPAIASAASPRTVTFSGRTWNIKTGFYAPGKNHWTDSSDAIYVDNQGQLHLKVMQVNGVWSSAEVFLPSSLGYGTYDFDIMTRVDKVDPNLVMSPFMYQDDSHEIDIEYTKWKVMDEFNTYETVHPVAIPGSDTKHAMQLHDGVFTGRIIWDPSGITMQNIQDGKVLNSWKYTGSNNFVPGGEQLHLNNWMIDGDAPSDGQPHDFVIKAFRFTPKGSDVGTPTPVVTPQPTPQPAPTPAPVPVITTPTPTPTTTALPYNSPAAIKQRHEAARLKAVAAHNALLAQQQEARKQALIAQIGIDAYNQFVADMAASNH